MARTVSIWLQDFETVITRGCVYNIILEPKTPDAEWMTMVKETR